MEIAILGIDLAKNLFRVHGVDTRGKTILQRQTGVFQICRGSKASEADVVL
jgi:hypothetical protein